MITTALVLNEIGKPFALEEIQVDALRPDEALVEIHATGICHTDLSIANGTIPATVPAILGHEGAGVVTQVGADVPGFAPGDKVVLSFSHCRICNQCKAGFPSYCYSFPARNFGGKRDDGSTTLRKTDAGGGRGCFSGFFGQSSFSRLAVVSGSSMVKVPASTNLALCSPLGCGLQTGAGAVLNKLNVQSGSSVAVFGVGAVGMSAVMASKMRNAKVIVAVDVQQSRLDLALKLGATHAFLGNDPDIVKKIHEAALPMGVNYAVECSGVPAVTDIMYHSLDNRGHGTAVGAPAPGIKTGIDIFHHVINGRSFSGCAEGDAIPTKLIPYLMDEHAKGNYPFDVLITYYDVRDYQNAIDDVTSGKTLKAVLVWK